MQIFLYEACCYILKTLIFNLPIQYVYHHGVYIFLALIFVKS